MGHLVRQRDETLDTVLAPHILGDSGTVTQVRQAIAVPLGGGRGSGRGVLSWAQLSRTPGAGPDACDRVLLVL